MNLKSTKKKNQLITANIFEQQELLKKAKVIRENLKASTWHELEINGKFDKNEKLSFISDDMLILGCDVGSETHYGEQSTPAAESSVSPPFRLIMIQRDSRVQRNGR